MSTHSFNTRIACEKNPTVLRYMCFQRSLQIPMAKLYYRA